MDAAVAKKRKLDENGSHDNGVCLLYLQPKIMFCLVFAIAMWVMTGVQVTIRRINGLLLPQLICVSLAIGVKLFRYDHNIPACVSWIFKDLYVVGIKTGCCI